MQPWWLDAVCGDDNWQVCLATNGDGEITGVLPYFLRRKYGLRFILMPPFTDYIGPLLVYPDKQQGFARQYAFEKQTLGQLIEQLPSFHFFNQQYFPAFDYWLPFYWRGYHQTTLYTYVIDQPQETTVVYENFKGSVRTDIKKAAAQIEVRSSEDLETFIRLHRRTLEQQRRLPYPADTLRRLDAALQQRSQRQLLLAFDTETATAHAGLYIAYDEQTAYFMLVAIDPSYRRFASLQLLYWEAIQQFSGKVIRIDFCGSMIEGVERATRAFGAKRIAHYRVYKSANPWLRLLSMILQRGYDG